MADWGWGGWRVCGCGVRVNGCAGVMSRCVGVQVYI